PRNRIRPTIMTSSPTMSSLGPLPFAYHFRGQRGNGSKFLILKEPSSGVSKDEAKVGASWFETRGVYHRTGPRGSDPLALLTMRVFHFASVALPNSRLST